MKNKFNLRIVSQIAVVLLILGLAFAHQKWGIEKAASVDAYCPFGALESLITTIKTGDFLQRIYYSNFILLALFTIMTIFFGRVFCSYFCPLGALQEWLRALGKKIGFKKDYELPKVVDKYLRYAKHIILAFLIFASFVYTDLVFRYADPFVAFSHLGNEFEEIYIAYIILGLLIISSIFSKSWWCRYFCPLGSYFAILKKFSFFKLNRDDSTCTKCNKCNRSCPSGLNVASSDELNSTECISCMNCVSSCSKTSSISAKIGKWNIEKKKYEKIVTISFLVVLLSIIVMPFWQTKPDSNLKLKDGSLNLDELRGSNTLEYLIRETGVPYDYYKKELGLPDGIDMGSKLKHVGEDYGVNNKDGEPIEMEDFKEVTEKYIEQNKK